jgi:hypothetical protein
MFEKPLYNFALAGDVNLNLSLNYNGSVSHQFFLGDTSSYNTDPDLRRYNLNVAEWIISLNGIAIQALNFETNIFTDPLAFGLPVSSQVMEIFHTSQVNGNYKFFTKLLLLYSHSRRHHIMFEITKLILTKSGINLTPYNMNPI